MDLVQNLLLLSGNFRKINETGDRSKDEWTLFNKEEIIKFLKVYHDGEGFESGVTFKINPFKAEIVKRENRCLDEYIKEYKYCLVESDTMSLDEQYAMVKFLKLPYVMITYSGNKSIHTLVRVDAGGSKNLYRERQKFIEDFCTANGFEIDSACKNPGRESRCPGFSGRWESSEFCRSWLLLQKAVNSIRMKIGRRGLSSIVHSKVRTKGKLRF